VQSAHPILLGFLVAVTAVVGIGIGVRIFMSRTSQNQVAKQEQVDLATLRPPLPPPSFLACPPHYCAAHPGMTVPIFAVRLQRLRDDWTKMIGRQPRVVEVNAQPDRRQLTYIQHSLVFRFPDIITVELVPFGPDRSSLALYSRSRYGRYDFHQNRRRVAAWLSQLEELTAPMTRVLHRFD
jgi:uncharacterized protein (DUF1499 family)